MSLYRPYLPGFLTSLSCVLLPPSGSLSLPAYGKHQGFISTSYCILGSHLGLILPTHGAAHLVSTKSHYRFR